MPMVQDFVERVARTIRMMDDKNRAEPLGRDRDAATIACIIPVRWSAKIQVKKFAPLKVPALADEAFTHTGGSVAASSW